MQRYRTIVADPPWEYERQLYLDPDGYHHEPFKYDVLSVEDICALDVRSLCADYKDGTALFLWTTNLYLRDSFDVLDSWGFRYRQTVTWNKIGVMPAGGSVAPCQR